MKPSLPKSLILSFFLIGIILGLLFLDVDLYHQPPAPGAQPQAAGAPVPPPAKRPVRESVSKAIARVVPQKPLPPPSVVEPVSCDRTAAWRVRERAREIAEITTGEGGALSVRLGREWAFYSEGHRAGFVQAFSDSDACLLGRPRPIHFYFEGREVALADPITGVTMR